MTQPATRRARALLPGPGPGCLPVLLIVPPVLVLAHAFFRRGRFGGVVHKRTTEDFTRLAGPLSLDVVAHSARIALLSGARPALRRDARAGAARGLGGVSVQARAAPGGRVPLSWHPDDSVLINSTGGEGK